jgi:GntR family transcriptional regulator/MocR family aminotransferase
MPRSPLQLPLDRASGVALAVQIAQGIADHVRNGRLRPGAPLPGTRELARTLGVHRNTVIAAYAELAAEGCVTARAARGTFVARELPDPSPRRFTSAAGAAGAAAGAAPRDRRRSPYVLRDGPPSWLHFNSAPEVPMVGNRLDLSLVPSAALARAYRRSLQRGRGLLGYADPRGHPRLRTAIADLLVGTRAVPATADRVVVTRGGQMALALVARTLLAPGDVVAVEALGYRPAWQVMRDAGATLVPVPVDRGGLDVDAIARIARRGRLRAVYCTPHHQYPTTVSLAPARRTALLALAQRHRFAIVEEDYDHEFHFDGRPLLPLASADPEGHVIYVGTLSKLFAPGLRVGYVVAPEQVAERVAVHRSYLDLCGDPALECAIAELFEEGEVQRHVRRVRRVYRARRDALVNALRQRLDGAVRFDLPGGGISIWCRLRRRVNVEAWAERCLNAGVRFRTARWFAFDEKPQPAFRLGFAALTEAQIEQSVRTMASELRR